MILNRKKGGNNFVSRVEFVLHKQDPHFFTWVNCVIFGQQIANKDYFTHLFFSVFALNYKLTPVISQKLVNNIASLNLANYPERLIFGLILQNFTLVLLLTYATNSKSASSATSVANKAQARGELALCHINGKLNMQMVDFDAKFNASFSSYIWIPGVPGSHVIAHKHITNHAYPHGTVYKNRIVYADIRPNLCGQADISIYVVIRSIYWSQYSKQVWKI